MVPRTLDVVDLTVMWQQLVACADEAGYRLMRSSFSNEVREAFDFACVLLDRQGRLLVQSATGHHMFASCLPHTAAALFAHFPPATLSPDDILLTNDPWLGTGHLNDMTMVKPLFHRDQIVAFAGSVAHYTDVGGIISSVGARQVYEEGLRIPPIKLVKAGRLNHDLVNLLSANVRMPDRTLGDMRAQMTVLSLLDQRVADFLRSWGLSDLDRLTEEVVTRSRAAITKRIRELIPEGTYSAESFTDGFEEPLRIRVTVAVFDGRIAVDYGGSSPQADRAINSTQVYTAAYTNFALKCILGPDIPNNYGCYAPITVTVPEGSFLNCRPPAPVRIRGRTGQYIPGVIFKALAAAAPGRVMAPGGQPMWWLQFYFAGQDGQPVAHPLFLNGGQGARPSKDGIACLAFPSPIATIPVEALEAEVPVLVREKTLRTDSGGPGRYRGGLGQQVTLESRADGVTLVLNNERVRCPAEGLLGGLPGAAGQNLLNGQEIPGKTQTLLNRGDRVTLCLPGGGGFLPPTERDAQAVERDLRDGLISANQAREAYGYGPERSLQMAQPQGG